MIKIIIADDNDILFNSLSDIALKNEETIELINVPKDKLGNLICHTRKNKNIIILDYSITSVTFCTNILNNAIRQVAKENVIILIINSNNITNIIRKEKKHHFFFKKKTNLFSLLDIVNLVTESMNQTLEVERNIDSILWQIGFTTTLKGYKYIKDAISFAYIDNKLLLDTKTLVKKVAEKNNVKNDKLVRSDMDKSLNTVLDLLDINILYKIFDEYDGRKISLSYLIGLCIRKLEKQRYCCLN